MVLSSRLPGLLAILAGWPRRVAAVLCLVLAALTALGSTDAPASRHRSPVVVTAKPLSPGAVLAAADLAILDWPDELVPAGAVRRLADVLGHTVAAAMTPGEPLTAARLLDTGLSAALKPGQVALTIGLASGSQAAILQAGALVDLYAADSDTALIAGSPLPAGSGRLLGASLRVLAVLPARAEPAGEAAGPSLVIAADRSTAARFADHPAGQFLASLVPPS
jgi:pilus assembly protein CpaB